MIIDDIFRQRKTRWNRLIKARRLDKVNTECPKCHGTFDNKTVKDNLFVCPECRHYLSIPAICRVEMVCDRDTFKEMNSNLKSVNPLDFPDYDKQLEKNVHKTGMSDSCLTGTGKIKDIDVAIAVLDSRFLMGSMGTVVGEKIVRLTEYATKKKLPLIIFSASGGARMQEGMFSLMQMARTAAAIEKFKNAGGLFISYMTNPTTGGVSASFASLGDINIAEPKALICFAGPRVIEQTIGQKLPEGFQRSEFLLEHGMLDMIVERENQKNILGKLLAHHRRQN